MNKRLLQFIEAENLTQSQFADTLGVARASISHILSGRNKPGYDFIESLVLKFPSLNMEWFLTGQGKMYKSPQQQQQQQPQVPAPVPEELAEADLFSQIPEESAPDSEEEPEPRHICKIIALYSDGTFSELS